MYVITTIFLFIWTFLLSVTEGIKNDTTSHDLGPTAESGRNDSYSLTSKEEAYCASFTNTTCEKCVKSNKKCYYCYKSNKCAYYPYKHLVTQDDCGSLGDMAWTTCLVNFEALIVSMTVVGGILLLAIGICCCCCCWQGKHEEKKWDSEEANLEEQQDQQKASEEGRKQERKHEICRKYSASTNHTNSSEQALLLTSSV